MTDQDLEKFQSLIDNAHSIVFFGGAGVSTESGIPDFRSQDGLYNQKYKYPPEEIISHTFFIHRTEEFYEFYKDRMLFLDAEPNITHKTLAKLEKAGKLSAVVTQNIDGLHQRAGSKNVFELHGSVLRNYCTKCRKFYDVNFIKNSKGVPLCSCGGVIKPDVVLYEEGLDMRIVDGAIQAIEDADLLIIAGTSLVVQPAAGLINYYHGKDIVLINKTPTLADYRATITFHEPMGEVFSRLKI